MNAVLSDMDTGAARFKAAYDALSGHPAADTGRLAAIGYCFGGAMVLHGARIGMDLKGVVSFHGSLGSFHKPARGEVKAKVLVCHGAADALISGEDVSNFKQEMADAGADCRFVAYEGALHGFTNPGGHRERREVRPAAQVRRGGRSAFVGRHEGAVLADFLNRIPCRSTRTGGNVGTDPLPGDLRARSRTPLFMSPPRSGAYAPAPGWRPARGRRR